MIYKKKILTQKERKLKEEAEKFEAMGGDSEALGRKTVSEVMREEDNAQKQQLEAFMGILDAKRRSNEYNKRLARILDTFVLQEELEPAVGWKIYYDTKGVILDVFYGKKMYRRAFRACREPAYDLNAAKNFAVSIGYLIQRENAGANPTGILTRSN